MFVADGNFKADHVWQKKSENNVWLWDGGGMLLNEKRYSDFLQSASERLTVRVSVVGMCRCQYK
jgi:hypothetical protein